MKDKIIVALDFANKEDCMRFLRPLKGELSWVKVGMELFYKEGRTIVEELKDLDFQIFLDLKLHDIPNTVEKATRSLLTLPIDMLNFHVAGGSEMMKRVASIKPKNMKFIGVTQLTSSDEGMLKNELRIDRPMQETVMSYAKLAKESGLDGVVCSALDTNMIKQNIPDFVTVCPGIRMLSDNQDDQKRITTPKQAINDGADYLVVGRSITQAIDPLAAIEAIQKDMTI